MNAINFVAPHATRDTPCVVEPWSARTSVGQVLDTFGDTLRTGDLSDVIKNLPDDRDFAADLVSAVLGATVLNGGRRFLHDLSVKSPQVLSLMGELRALSPNLVTPAGGVRHPGPGRDGWQGLG